MIRVRYRDPSELPPGLHAAAECHGRTTTVYLLSGLTAAQRRSALRRLRLSARMGHCPRLPAARLGLALLADRIRTSAGQAGAVFRLHPAGSTVPVMVLSGGAIAFLLFCTVSIRVLPGQRTGPAPDPGTPPAASAAIPITSWPRAAGPGGPGPRHPGGPGGSSPATSPRRAGRRGAQGSTGAGGTTLSGAANPAPASSQGGGTITPAPASSQSGGTTTPAPAPGTPSPSGGGSTPSSAPQPAPGTTASSSGLCAQVGPLGVCLDS